MASVEYFLLCGAGVDVRDVLLGHVREALDVDAPDDETLKELLSARYEVIREDGRSIVGVAVDIPLEEPRFAEVVSDLTQALLNAGADGIEHVVKFVDPHLLDENKRLMEEIFRIEMRLREALTVILVDAFPDHCYDLLRDLHVTPAERPSEEQLRAKCQNELFFLLFSQYIEIDRRAMPRNVDKLVELVRAAGDFDEVQTALDPDWLPEPYADFMAEVREFLQPVENMRNAVAHNRDPSSGVAGNYEKARNQLLEAIDRFMAERPPQTQF